MIMETFFLVEEKRALSTRNFHQKKSFQDLRADLPGISGNVGQARPRGPRSGGSQAARSR
jgi:hypothetical protein